MKTWPRFCAGLAVLVGLIPEAWAQQFPGIPSPTPLPPAPVAPAAVPVVPVAPSNNLFSFLCLSPAPKQACKECLCQSQLGLLLGNTPAPVNPASAAPGGSSYHPLGPVSPAVRPATTASLGTAPVDTVVFRPEPLKPKAAPTVAASAVPAPRPQEPRREQAPSAPTAAAPVPASDPEVTPYAPMTSGGAAAPSRPPTLHSAVPPAPGTSSYHALDPVPPPARPAATSSTEKPSLTATPYAPIAPEAAGTGRLPAPANPARPVPTTSAYHPLAPVTLPVAAAKAPSHAPPLIETVAFRPESRKPEAAPIVSAAVAPPTAPEKPQPERPASVTTVELASTAAPRPAVVPAVTAPPDAVPPPAPAGTPYFRGLIGIVQESKYPSQREWAARALAEADWPSEDIAVAALLNAIRHDPSASVRAMCIRCLAQKKVRSAPVLQLLQQLKTDLSATNDPRVQYEAAQALTRLEGSATPSAPAGPTPGAP